MELYELHASDFGPYETLHLPLHKQGLVWIGGVNKDTDAADSNGSGKSTLFKALVWGLYGDSIDGEKGDGVIRSGAKKAVVKVVMVDGKGERWEIVRQRLKGSPRTVLIKPDGKAFEGSKTETQERIVRMVGLDFKAFKNTVLYGQNDSARFAHPKTKDADRKEMLHRILNTELLERCYSKAKESAKKRRVDNRERENKLDILRAAVDEHDVSGLDREREGYERQRSVKAKEHADLARRFRDRAKELMRQADEGLEFPDTAIIKKSILSKGEEIALAEKASSEAELLAKNLDVLLEEVLTLDRLKHGAISERDEASRQLRMLKGNNCPTCTAPLDEGASLEYIKGLKGKKRIAEEKLKEVEKNAKKSEVARDKLRAKYDKIESKASRLPELMRDQAKLNAKLADVKLEIAEAENRTNELRTAAKGLVEQARSELKAAKEVKQAKNPYVEQLEKAKARVAECKSKIAKLEKEIIEGNKELSYYEFWVKGFSNQGLPSYILDAVMPHITERTNYYLETLSDGDIAMEFSTQRELKSAKGEMRDEIDIRWEIEGENMYPPSGGQLKKMEVATDLALMDLVSVNEGGNLDLLMMDEVLDGLDVEGCSRVLLLLQKLRAKRGTIFVVSHESRMAEAFEKGIFAVKDGGITRLEVS
jgi:DNA repair exonuclease SbcCD ATPase subunit